MRRSSIPPYTRPRDFLGAHMQVDRCSLTALNLVFLLAASPLSAQVIYVDTSNDAIDFGGAQQVADLPGPDGVISLAEAALASDNTPGVQTIGFHVPQSQWQYQQFFPGRAVLRPFLGCRFFDTAIVDGTTQTAFTGDTNPNGGEVVIWAETYLIDSVGGAIRGLDNSSLHLSGGTGNAVQGNTQTGIEVFDSTANLIGGASPGQGNTGGFIQIDRASDNVVVGNTTKRVRVLGWIGGNQAATNNRIGGPAAGERNHITGLGTMNSQGIPSGFAIQLFDSIGTVIENNWIGTTPDGLQQGDAWTTMGIFFDGENHDTTIRDNLIAGIRATALPHLGPSYQIGTGIVVYGAGDGVTIVGNKIGLNANNQPVLGSVTGIAMLNYYLGPVQNIVIGGALANQGNEIAGHLGTGITVGNTFTGVRISGDSIHDNGGIGIDLITDAFVPGVTPNDPLDLDTGANGLQNFPVLQSATRAGNSLRVVGTLASTPSAVFALEFFASPQGDPSGFGEGQQYLGTATVTTDASGNAGIDVVLASPVPPGFAVSATATAVASASTSEFCAFVPVTGSPQQWGDLGYGLAGTAGVPLLTGTGGLTASSTVTWALSNARASSLSLFVLGFSQARLPLMGGTLVPSPDALVVSLTSSAGAASLALPLAVALPTGLELSVQVCILDPAGPFGWAAANAIAAIAP
ncbi:MAG: right-handed parallel beta-helix repeat-containing protein [Planctomycetota bacterium]